MNIRAIATILACAAAIAGRAQAIETIETVGGYSLTGYISGQHPGGVVVVTSDGDADETTMTMADIKQITREPYPANRANGLIDEVMLYNGKNLRGQIIKTIPGKEITLLDLAGKKHVLQMSDIETAARSVVDPAIPLFEQTPLIETFVFGKEVVDGLMVRQSMLSNEIVIATLAGDTIYRSNRELNDLTRLPNQHFQQRFKQPKKPARPRIVTANGTKLAKAPHGPAFAIGKTVDLNNTGIFVSVQPKAGKVVVSLPETTHKIMLVRLDYAKYFGTNRNIILKQSDLLTRSMPLESKQTDDDGMMSIAYSAPAGLYMLYDTVSGAAYLFHVK